MVFSVHGGCGGTSSCRNLLLFQYKSNRLSFTTNKSLLSSLKYFESACLENAFITENYFEFPLNVDGSLFVARNAFLGILKAGPHNSCPACLLKNERATHRHWLG